MRGLECAAIAALLLTGSCGGGSSNPAPVGTQLIQRVNTVVVPRAGGSPPLAAFALGRAAPGTTPDLFLAPTDGFPGCVGMSGPSFLAFPAAYGWAGYPNAESIVVADFVQDGALDDAIVTTLAGAGAGHTSLFGNVPMDNGVIIPNPWSDFHGGFATRVVAGDWNGDGNPDVAVLEPLDTRVRLFLGDGAGAFSAPPRLPATLDTELGPLALLTARVDNDTTDDLVIAHGFGSTVLVYLGNGDGSFTAAPDVAAVSSVQYMTPGDFDDDGALDLALSSNANDQVAILLGNDDGTFAAPALVTLPADSAPTGIAAADLDGDGDVDLAVGLTDEADVAILLNNGSGVFTLPASFRYAVPGGGTPRQVEVGDLEGDGDLDVFVLIDAAVVVFRQT